VRLQVTDDIGNSTLIGCRFKVTKGGAAVSEQGLQTPFTLIPRASSTSSGPSINTLLHDQTQLKEEISEVKQTLTEEKAHNAKRHEDLLNAIFALTVKFSTPPPKLFLLPVSNTV